MTVCLDPNSSKPLTRCLHQGTDHRRKRTNAPHWQDNSNRHVMYVQVVRVSDLADSGMRRKNVGNDCCCTRSMVAVQEHVAEARKAMRCASHDARYVWVATGLLAGQRSK